MRFLKSIGKGVGNLLSGGAIAARDARRQQQRAQEIQGRIEGRQMQRDRMQSLREAQIARAMGMQAAVSSGVADSSGFEGSQAGMQASALGNIAFSQQVETGVGQINRYMRRASRYAGQAQMWGVANQMLGRAVGVQMNSPDDASTADKAKMFFGG